MAVCAPLSTVHVRCHMYMHACKARIGMQTHQGHVRCLGYAASEDVCPCPRRQPRCGVKAGYSDVHVAEAVVEAGHKAAIRDDVQPFYAVQASKARLYARN